MEDQKTDCEGPGFHSRKIVTKWPRIMVVFVRNEGCILDIVRERILEGKMFILRGCICGDQLHFVAWLRNGDWEWVLFDGMRQGRKGLVFDAIEDEQSICKVCQLRGLNAAVFEVLE